MPKEFPQIRLHGNKEAAVLHSKRGMLELFKAQSWTELAGVPITKRSVEVDEYTTIIVQIAMDQTFIDITSNPPEGYVSHEVEREDEEFGRCPPGFIVRKLDHKEVWKADTLNEKYWTEEFGNKMTIDGYPGHIIAYNEKSGKWELAHFKEAELGPFEGAGAHGWWHLNEVAKDLSGSYKSCDLITLMGGGGGMAMSGRFHSMKSINGTDHVSGQMYLDNRFFMGGKEYDTPGDICYGACILKDTTTKQDFFHVMTSDVTVGSGSYSFHLTGHDIDIHRAPVGGDPLNWQLVKTLDAHADNASPFVRSPLPEGAITSVQSGLGYIDKKGYGYMMREYYAEDTREDTPSGQIQWKASQLIKIDLRSGVHTELRDSAYARMFHSSVNSGEGLSFIFNTPGHSVEGGFGTNNSSRWLEGPYVLCMYGGLDKMYHYELDGNITEGRVGQSSIAAGTKYTADEDHEYYTFTGSLTQTRQGQGDFRINVYEDEDKLVDSLILESHDVNYNITGEATFAGHRDRRSGGYGGVGHGRRTLRYVIDHHPQVKNSWEYMQFVTDWDDVSRVGTNTYSYHRDGKTLHSITTSITAAPDYARDGNTLNAGFPGEGWSGDGSGITDWNINDGNNPDVRWKYHNFDNEVDADGYLTGGKIPNNDPWHPVVNWRSDVPDWDETSSQHNGSYHLDSGQMGQPYITYNDLKPEQGSGRPSNPACGWGPTKRNYNTILVDNSYYEFGSSTGFDIAQPGATGPNRKLYRPEVRAVHRNIKGLKEKPFISLRRKVYMHDTPLARGSRPYVPYWYTRADGDWWQVYLAYRAPSADEGLANPLWQDLYGDVSVDSRDNILWWSKPLGNARDGYDWDEWEWKSNILDEKQINAIVGYDEEVDMGAKHMHFEIAVI